MFADKDTSGDEAESLRHLAASVSIEAMLLSKSAACAHRQTCVAHEQQPQHLRPTLASSARQAPGTDHSEFLDLVQRECQALAQWIAAEHELRMTDCASGCSPSGEHVLAQTIPAAPAAPQGPAVPSSAVAHRSPWHEPRLWEHAMDGSQESGAGEAREVSIERHSRPKSVRVRGASARDVQVFELSASAAHGVSSDGSQHSRPSNQSEDMRSDVTPVSTDQMRFVKLRAWDERSSQDTVDSTPSEKPLVGMAAAAAQDGSRAPMGARMGRCARHCVMNPERLHRALWDVIGMCCILYESILLPLHFFNIDDNPTMDSIEWFTRIFWTADLPVNFITAYTDSSGRIVRHPIKIAKRYLKSWFIIDMCVLIADWLVPFMVRTAKMGKMLKSLRLIKQARVCRILRLKADMLPRFLQPVIWSFHSGLAQIIMALLRMLVFMMWLIHIIACCWFAVADMSSSELTWIKVYDFAEASLADRYLSSYHWALANFSSGNVEITPQNVAERVFAVVTGFLAFVLAAWVVSSITTTMTRLEVAAAQEARLLSSLQSLLIDLKIPHHLSLRIRRNAKHALKEHRKNEPSVQLMNLISEPLRMELHYEMYMPLLRNHPFFRNFSRLHPAVMHQVCHAAIGKLLVTLGDVVFMEGDTSLVPQMYFVCSGGHLLYIRSRNSHMHPDWNLDIRANPDSQHCILTEGHWACEATLWTQWVHFGSLVARGDSVLLVLDAERFQRLAGGGRTCAFKYCDGFVSLLNAMDHEHLSDVADPAMDIGVVAEDACPVPPPAHRQVLFMRKLSKQLSALNISATLSSFLSRSRSAERSTEGCSSSS